MQDADNRAYEREARQFALSRLREFLNSGMYGPYAVRKVMDEFSEKYDLDSDALETLTEELFETALP